MNSIHIACLHQHQRKTALRRLTDAPRTRRDRRGDHNKGRRVVVAMAVMQTVGFGVLYYVFAVFLTALAAELDTRTTVVTGAATLSVLVAAVAAVPVGRWLVLQPDFVM